MATSDLLAKYMATPFVKAFDLRNSLAECLYKTFLHGAVLWSIYIIECDLAAVANFLVFVEKGNYRPRIF